MAEKIAKMNVMHGVDNFKIAIQAVFIQCNCVFRMLLETFRVIVRFTGEMLARNWDCRNLELKCQEIFGTYHNK
jgi:hypothetical protein